MRRNALYLVSILALLPRAISSGCNKDWCTSPDAIGGYDCWAGSSVEPCTCSTGKAKETGENTEYMGQTYYEYVCCTDGSGVGEQCGDFKELRRKESDKNTSPKIPAPKSPKKATPPAAAAAAAADNFVDANEEGADEDADEWIDEPAD
ncbi:unnamed protein product [Bathycoccus prasinos]